jgi:hypothetical protein
VIRYHYVSQLQPPAPFVYVTLRNPVTGTEQQDVPAQVDSVADRTVLPDAVVQALALPQIGTIPIGGVGGIVQVMPSYPVGVIAKTSLWALHRPATRRSRTPRRSTTTARIHTGSASVNWEATPTAREACSKVQSPKRQFKHGLAVARLDARSHTAKPGAPQTGHPSNGASGFSASPA